MCNFVENVVNLSFFKPCYVSFLSVCVPTAATFSHLHITANGVLFKLLFVCAAYILYVLSENHHIV